MSKKRLIPIFREVDNNKLEFTYLLDNQSWQIYKSVKEGGNDYKFWVAWALVLILLRSIESIHLSISNPINVLIIMLLFIISGRLGVYKYKNTYKNKKEVFFTQDMIEDYIDKGKATLKSDIRVTVVTFLAFITFMVLFLIYQWLIWLLFALFLFFGFIISIYYLPIERFRLYKRKD